MVTESNPTITSNDYVELLLRHLVRDPAVFNKARDFRVTGDDFILNDEYGMSVYKGVVDSVMEINSCPIDPALFSLHLNKRLSSREIPEELYDSCCELMAFMYSGTLNTEYFLRTLKDFLRAKRGSKAVFQYQDNITELSGRLGDIGVALDMADGLDGAENVHPFLAPIFSVTSDTVLTGFRSLDQITNGLAPGEYGQIIGYSGGGKTALGCCFAFNAAEAGNNATFVSLEGSTTEIAHRFYANLFEIPYTELHKGAANMLLEQEFRDPQHADKLALMQQHLSIEGMKGLTPVNVDQIYARLVQKYETTGFIPKVVVIDQLQFIEPRNRLKSDAEWQCEKKAAAEVDELSHLQIDGHNFACWLLHQAKGKLKRIFTREDLDGFKGIIHKADLTIGIGRENQQSQDFSLFSIKARHCPDFSLNYLGNLVYMKFQDAAQSSSLAREGFSHNEHTAQSRQPVGVEP